MSSSKMVNDRQRSARIVAEAAETHGDKIGAMLDQMFAVPGEPPPEAPPAPAKGKKARGRAGAAADAPVKAQDDGQPPIEWARVVRHIGRSIKAKMDVLVAADAAHVAEKADDVEPRSRRDRFQGSLYKRLALLRSVLQSVYGDDAVQKLGFAGPTPSEPIALCRLGRVVHDNLPAVAGLPPLAPGLSFDAALHGSELADDVAGLELALQDLAREAKELDATQVHKDRALADYDLHFSNSARALEALFMLAGEHALAARVRPSLRRPGRTHLDEGDAPDADAGASAGDGGEPGEAPASQPAA